ncbi:Mismatch repair protein msh3 [Irineochytrium annulatum]|nr:Mismatch repair protein msh3 [Irineochytrium annulatum]
MPTEDTQTTRSGKLFKRAGPKSRDGGHGERGMPLFGRGRSSESVLESEDTIHDDADSVSVKSKAASIAGDVVGGIMKGMSRGLSKMASMSGLKKNGGNGSRRGFSSSSSSDVAGTSSSSGSSRVREWMDMGPASAPPLPAQNHYNAFSGPSEFPSGKYIESESRPAFSPPPQLPLPALRSKPLEIPAKSASATQWVVENKRFKSSSKDNYEPEPLADESRLRASKEKADAGPVLVCLKAVHNYLVEFGLEHALLLTKSFESFENVGHMVLNATALAQLEVFVVDGGEGNGLRGSLLWVLDHTVTKFGRRLLRKWIGKPLVKVEALKDRVEAIEEFLAKTQDVWGLLSALEKVASLFTKSAADRDFSARLVKKILGALSNVKEDVQEFLNAMDESAAKDGKKENLFRERERCPEVFRLKEEIEQIKADFASLLKEARQTMKISSLEFVTVSGIEVSD